MSRDRTLPPRAGWLWCACIVAAGPFAALPVTAAPAALIAHHAVSTRDAEAQRQFDQGLTLIYAFNPEEATFHFQEAARRDPKLAMAFWGIALAAGPNINTGYDLRRARIGRQAAELALRLAAHAPPEERAYIETVRQRYDATDARQALLAQKAYAKAMKALARAYPGDVDASVLYAESLMDLTPLHMWLGSGAPNTYTREVIALLDAALKRNPRHVGALHYLIHTYEASPTPGKALDAARRLAAATLPDGAEHLAHMPSHIFMRTGDYDGAIAANLKALSMFARLIHDEHSDVHNGYYRHDDQVLDYAYMMSGQWSKAHAAAQAIATQSADNAAGIETYLRFHRWREVLALSPPSDPDTRWRFATAMAQAGVGDLADARSGLRALAEMRGRDARTQLARTQLAAQIDIAEGRSDAAIGELRSATRIQDRLPVREPPAWYYPVRETLGARLALAGKFRAAAAVFQEDLRGNPNNPRSLYGLATVLKQVDPGRAPVVQRAFEKAWRHADVSLTLEDL